MVPARGRDETRLSSRSLRSASRTVYLLTAKRSHNSCSVGSCVPTGYTPSTISLRRMRATCR